MAAGSTKREFEGSGDTQVVFKKKKDKCRVDNCFAEMGHIHKVVTRNLLQDVAMEMRSFVDQGCSTFIKINRLTLLNSNAIDGSSFSKAFCRISENDDEHSFACLFKKGLHILMTYMERKEMPVNEQESLVLDTLLHYLFEMKNAETKAPFGVLGNLGETDITIILTNHLFGKLCTSSHFLIDKQFKGKSKAKESCPCSNTECKITGSFGDTGIGNPSVWHGNLDVIVNNQVVVEALEEDEPNVSESSERIQMEVNMKPVCRSTNQQIIAETIVFTFFRRKDTR
ncbi:uncharacterized protein LOC117318749 [Pecten maximus]|uniref:uncharacterized protein LOC117318749 n=1 Tax=Pecten maximus TaxID=6579 RepID=UPI0014586C50|nr:uncharacterized protein LOC117318749 [Pecten maximus]